MTYNMSYYVTYNMSDFDYRSKKEKKWHFLSSPIILNVKVWFFSSTSGYLKWSKHLPSHHFNLCLCPQKKFERISCIERPWWSAPILSLKKKLVNKNDNIVSNLKFFDKSLKWIQLQFQILNSIGASMVYQC